MARILAFFVAALGLVSCTGTAEVLPPSADAAAPAGEPTPAEDATRPSIDPRFIDPLQAVLAAYSGWGRVDDEARWAPFRCRMPFAARARVSESDDADSHGEKLYTLYAMDPEGYGVRRSMTPATPLAGLDQVIVKESFTPVPFAQADDVDRALGGGVGPHQLIPAVRDGRHFMAGDPLGLYVMMKPHDAVEGTDEGWVYATVAPDMTTVTALGIIDSCADCHAEAGEGRLFGVPDLPLPAKARNAAP